MALGSCWGVSSLPLRRKILNACLFLLSPPAPPAGEVTQSTLAALIRDSVIFGIVRAFGA